MDFLRKLQDHFIPSARNVYRPHLLRKPWLIFFVAVVLTSESVFLLDLVARQSAFDFVAAVLPGEVVALTNTERTEENVAPLKQNELLARAAQAKAEDMAAKGYFSHVSPDGSEPWVWVRGAGYNYQYAGENLAVKFTDSSEVVNAWMASPTHRANIVKPQYTEIGVGIAQGEFKGEQATYVVQYFGTPREVGAAPQPALLAATNGTRTTPQENVVPQVQGAADESQQVAAAEATPLPPRTTHAEQPWSSFAKNLLSTETQPSVSVSWILAGIASLLVIGLALAFFVHIQIQPTDMLIGGAVVAVITLAFLALNMQTIALPHTQQTAAVFGAVPADGGFIDNAAAAQ